MPWAHRPSPLGQSMPLFLGLVHRCSYQPITRLLYTILRQLHKTMGASLMTAPPAPRPGQRLDQGPNGQLVGSSTTPLDDFII